MYIAWEPEGVALLSDGRSFRLEWPEFHVEEGILNRANCFKSDSEISDSGGFIHLSWDIRERVYNANVSITKRGNAFCWQLNLAPENGLAWKLARSSEGSGLLDGWQDASALRLFHADNVRGVSQNAPVLDGSYFARISDWVRPLNDGRWQGFPGLWIIEDATSHGFVCGVLTQAMWKHTVHCAEAIDSKLRLRGMMSAPGIEVKTFAPGEDYQGETLYFEWVKAKTPAEALPGYLEALCENLTPCKLHSPLQKNVSWGSWNDRKPHFWDVSQDLVRRTMRVLRERFPTVGMVQIDDGYADGGCHEVVADCWTKLEHGLITDEEVTIAQPRRLGAAFMHEPGYAIAKDRFPDGMRHVRDEIDAVGFSPGIWLGLNTIFDASLVLDHPEWFVAAEAWPDSDTELQTYFGGSPGQGFRVLDPSVPEVQEYIRDLTKLLFAEWGFASLKLDFWSYAFENDCFRLQVDKKTAYELRNWFFNQLRAELGPAGYLMIACDTSTGSPFVCEWVDNVRYGIDIGNGRWESIRYTALVGTFLLHVEAYRYQILNSDSVGLLEGLPENERRVFLAWAVVTRSLCEVGGDLAIQDRDKLRELQKLLLAPRNGEPAYPGEYGHLELNEPAGVVWTRGDLFSATGSDAYLPYAVLAIFNWSDSERTITVDSQRIGCAGKTVIAVDFFEGDHRVHQESWDVSLPPRSVRLSHIAITSPTEPCLLESFWRVCSLTWDGRSLSIQSRGDAGGGMSIYWPFSKRSIVNSSLPVQVSEGSGNIVHLTPNLNEDEIQDWTIIISTDA